MPGGVRRLHAGLAYHGDTGRARSRGKRVLVGGLGVFVDDQPEVAIIFSWHIADELAPKLRAKGYRGKLVTPLPVPREL